MIFLNILFWIVFFYSLFARVLRWLSIWQQKEYRFDRLFAFFATKEGKKEIQKIVILPLKKSELKRPVITKKIIIIGLITILSMLLFDWNSWISIAIYYLVIPIIVVISSLPALLVTKIILVYYEHSASKKIKHFKPTIIGVSGSYGKTTTKILIKNLLSSQKKVWMSPKSHNTPLSIAMAINNSYKGETIIILEYASYKEGEISHLTKLYPPQIGVFTGINNQHLALFGSWEKMIKAETELFESLPNGAFLFYNHLDEEVLKIIKNFNHLNLVPSYNDLIKKTNLNSQGFLNLILDNSRISTRLLGDHYLTNLIQAINIALHLGLKTKEISESIEKFSPGDEFIRLIQFKNDIKVVVDDRTSNYNGMISAFDLVNHINAKTKILVTGGIVDLGDQASETHQNIAKRAKKVFDQVWYTSEVEKEVMVEKLGNKYYSITNIDQLITQFNTVKKDNILILIEGKIPKDIDNYLKISL